MVREVEVELSETWLENKRFKYKKYSNGAAENFGANLVHLLNLVQVTNSNDLPPVWEALAQASQQ